MHRGTTPSSSLSDIWVLRVQITQASQIPSSDAPVLLARGVASAALRFLNLEAREAMGQKPYVGGHQRMLQFQKRTWLPTPVYSRQGEALVLHPATISTMCQRQATCHGGGEGKCM